MMDVFLAVQKSPPPQPEDSLFFLIAMVFSIFAIGVYVGMRLIQHDNLNIRADKRKAIRDAYESTFNDFSEVNRHQYAILTMMVLNETTGGRFPTPKGQEGFKNMWREIEYRYRHWVRKEIAEGPFTSEPPPVPPPTGNEGAN